MSIKEALLSLNSNKSFTRYKSHIVLLILVLFFWGVFKILTPHNFGSFENLFSYLQSSLMYSVAACGFYFIIIMGLFDFSLGANIVLSGILACFFSYRLGYLGFIIAPIICGTFIGFINGFLYTRLRIPSMIVTVGLSLIYESLGALIAGGKVLTLDRQYQVFGSAPANILLALFVFLLASGLLRYTKIGTYTYAIGSNEFVAKSMGISVNKYKIIAFMILGCFAGLMSIMAVSYGTSIAAATGMATMSRNFTPIMGCFFGVAFKKYGSPILAIVIGEFIITLIFNGFVAIGAPVTIQNVVTGAALLIIVALTARPVKGAVIK
jgi:ribose transport system permease protein